MDVKRSRILNLETRADICIVRRLHLLGLTLGLPEFQLTVRGPQERTLIVRDRSVSLLGADTLPRR